MVVRRILRIPDLQNHFQCSLCRAVWWFIEGGLLLRVLDDLSVLSL